MKTKQAAAAWWHIGMSFALPSVGSLARTAYVSSWNAGFASLMPRRQAKSQLVARWRRDLLAPPPHRWCVAELDGAIIGFTGVGPSRDPIDPKMGELDSIAVDPSTWRRGIGRMLMSTALHALMADGYREAVLWTLTGYEQGKRLYESMGWHLEGSARAEGRQIRYRRGLASARR